MSTKVAIPQPISCLPGVQPSTDRTPYATKHYTFSDKIRFVDGLPRKVGGCQLSLFLNGETILGACRSIFSASINDRVVTVLGTDKRLYGQIGSNLVNITPFQTSTIAIANSLDTSYDTLANNPFTTTLNSNTVTVADAEAARYKIGDRVTISGAVGFAGLTGLNAVHIIRSVSIGSYTIRVGQLANASTSGGGAAVVRASGLMSVAAVQTLANGDRVKIAGAANTGGILAADINQEFIIRNVTGTSFDIYTDGVATSSVTSGGGAAVVYSAPLASGRRDASLGQGYGMGLYGAGLYGVSKLSAQGITYPRIWFFSRYGNSIIATPGGQNPVYQWFADTEVAPAIIANAPTAVNYAFIQNNTLVTFGAGNVPNKIFASDQGNITNWTASSLNTVFEDEVEGAGTLTSHVEVLAQSLIFTEQRCYTFRFIGRPNVWEIKEKANVGIIGPMARVTVNDVAYWMSDKNFHMWRGGNVEIIPANSQAQSTILSYVFDNLNFNQKSKSFAWYNRQFNEIWFHYPSAQSNDPDRIARLCLTDMSWTPDTWDRTAAEYPDILLGNPRLAYSGPVESQLYKHELGTDNDSDPLPFTLRTNYRSQAKPVTVAVAVVPDSGQVGDITVTITGYEWPQSTTPTMSDPYTITPTQERDPITFSGRFWQYQWDGEELGQSWMMGNWGEEIQQGGAN